MAVSRIDSRNTHGWFVRVARGSKLHGTKKESNAMFSDLKCGGVESALLQAQECERQLLLENPKLPFRRHHHMGSNTPVCGVSYTYHRKRHSRVKYYGYSVSTRDGDKKRTKFFSFNKYGAAAFDEAVAYRHEWERREAEKLGVQRFEPTPVS